MCRRGAHADERPACALFSRVGLAEMVGEPTDRAGQEIFAVGRWAATQEEVRTARIAGELGLDPRFEQCDKHLLALADRAAVIFFTVDDQRRCLGAVDEGRGGVGGIPFPVFVRGRAELRLTEGVADVTRAVERFEVEARCTANRRLEAIGLPDRPRGHEPAIAIAEDAELILVDIWLLQRLVHDAHQILEILVTPVADDLLGEVAAIGGRAARIGVNHDEPRGGERLLDIVEAPTVEAVRPAVDVENERVALGRIEARRFEEPGFDLVLAALDREELRGARGMRGEERVVVMGDDRRLVGLRIGDGDLADRVGGGVIVRDITLVAIDARLCANRSPTLNWLDRAGLAVDDVQAARARPDRVEKDLALIEPDRL